MRRRFGGSLVVTGIVFELVLGGPFTGIGLACIVMGAVALAWRPGVGDEQRELPPPAPTELAAPHGRGEPVAGAVLVTIGDP